MKKKAARKDLSHVNMMTRDTQSRQDGKWSITNIYLSGQFPVEFMMKLSGHKKYDTFKKYVRMALDEYADDIAKSAENCFF